MKIKSINMVMAIFCLFIFLINVGVHNASASSSNGYSNGSSNAIGDVLCTVVRFLISEAARGVAVIAIVVVGVGLFLGKFSWGVGIATAIGIGMIFGAPTIVYWLASGISGTKSNLTGPGDICPTF